MPTPVTVFKDGKSVNHVYLDELPHWLSQGWVVQNQTDFPIPEIVLEEIKTEAIAEVEIAEETPIDFSNLSWRELKELADKHGLIKPDNLSWTEFIPEIKQAIAS
jgi:hypothetical protein